MRPPAVKKTIRCQFAPGGIEWYLDESLNSRYLGGEENQLQVSRKEGRRHTAPRYLGGEEINCNQVEKRETRHTTPRSPCSATLKLVLAWLMSVTNGRSGGYPADSRRPTSIPVCSRRVVIGKRKQRGSCWTTTGVKGSTFVHCRDERGADTL